MLSPFSKQSTPVNESPISGGGFSDDGRFSYGYWSICGKRMSMEDFMEAKILSLDGQTVGLFGVYDGHRGPKAAEYVKKNLLDNLTSHPKFKSDMKAAIAETYLKTDDDYLKMHTGQDAEAGSTASTAVLYGNRMFIANVGDSRAVISKGGKAVPVSLDHKPDLSDERERVEKAGGIVVWSGSWRVGGVLAVSRAFGNKSLKPYVVADPAIQEEIITDDLETLIIASDGLWDVVSNQVAVSLVKDISDPEEAARTLTSVASQQGSWDNITCIVVRFLHEKVEGSSAEEKKEP